MVQKSALVEKQIKIRENATYGRSNVLGLDADNNSTNGNATMTRNEKNWQSSVFAGPKIEASKRPRLNNKDKGREGLFGDSMEKDAYQKKTNLAAAISSREATRGPVFDQSGADERKARELYGNSSYAPVGN